MTKPGDNRIRGSVVRATERAQFVRVDFGQEMVVDVPREVWGVVDAERALWVEIPAGALRQLSGVAGKTGPIGAAPPR